MSGRGAAVEASTPKQHLAVSLAGQMTKDNQRTEFRNTWPAALNSKQSGRRPQDWLLEGKSGQSGQARSNPARTATWNLSEQLDFTEFLQRQNSHLQVCVIKTLAVWQFHMHQHFVHMPDSYLTSGCNKLCGHHIFSPIATLCSSRTGRLECLWTPESLMEGTSSADALPAYGNKETASKPGSTKGPGHLCWQQGAAQALDEHTGDTRNIFQADVQMGWESITWVLPECRWKQYETWLRMQSSHRAWQQSVLLGNARSEVPICAGPEESTARPEECHRPPEIYSAGATPHCGYPEETLSHKLPAGSIGEPAASP